MFRLPKLDVDWSLPRADSAGRKPEVKVDPFMDINDAFSRRDLTINAMGIDLKTFELIDPFEGQEDLQHKILRAPDIKRFVEDPLRFFRVMQFISRFDMQPDKQLNDVCKKMDLKNVSLERIETEFEKMLLRSKQPSLGIRWLHKIGRLDDLLPELAAMVHTIQGKDVHPEGNVFEHTMQTLDAAAQQEYDSDAQKLTILFAALCHDLGKPETTGEIDGKIHSYGHEQIGAKIAKKMLKRITGKKQLIDDVCLLVQYHMMPMQFIEGKAKPPAYKRLARKLASRVTLSMLAKLAQADKQGRNPKGHKPLTKEDKVVKKFLDHARDIQVHIKHEEPILQGRDLLDIIKPGPKMGELLEQAYEIQIEEGIKDKEELKKRVLK